MTEEVKEERYRVGVLDKAFTVLEKLVQYPDGIALKQLSDVTGINKSTLFRILYTMQANGYMSPPDNGVYKLNYKFISLFSSFPDADMREIAKRYLPLLARSSGKIPYFYVQDGDHSICIAKYDELHNKRIKINVAVGERVYLHCTSGGKIFLAAMTDQELNRWLSRMELVPKTIHTITDRDQLFQEIQRVRAQGYSINNIENEENIISVAAPVHNCEGKVIAAINVGDTILDFKEDTIADVAKIVIRYADEISREFGYFPENFPGPFAVKGG